MRVTRLVPAIAIVIAAGGCKGRAVDLLSLRVDSGMPVAPSPTEEPRQIHFTFTAPDAVTFDWRGSDAALRVWAKNVAPRTIDAHRPEPAPFSSPGPWQEATVNGLIPGTDYQYEVGHPVRPMTQTFRAPNCNSPH